MPPVSLSLSDIGLRRQRNEDRLLARDDLGLWAVADGLGGLADGDKAAQAVVDALAAMAPAATVEETAAAMLAAIDTASGTIFAAATAAGQRSGTTLAAMAHREGLALLCWCGDSRVYRLRGGELVPFTRDHSYGNFLIDAGIHTEETIHTEPDRDHIARCIGTQPEADPQFGTVGIEPGDLFLLCTDGVHGEISHEALQLALVQTSLPRPEALKDRIYRAGAFDNLTFVLVQF